jgi:hypothetical protein
MMSECFVYTITDPRDYLVKYVGITTDIKTRFAKHNSIKQDKEGILKRNWILKIKSLGLNPIFDIIDEGTINYCQVAETNYIKLYKSFGAKLKNRQKTGFLFKHTDETKKKISDIKKGTKLTEEHKLKLKINSGKFWLGKKLSKEHLNKISENRKGIVSYNKGLYKINNEMIAKLQDEYKNNKISQLQLAKKYNISKSSIDRYLKIKLCP